MEQFGRLDLIAHIAQGAKVLVCEADTLESFDEVLTRIRRLDGIVASETSLLLTTRKST